MSIFSDSYGLILNIGEVIKQNYGTFDSYVQKTKHLDDKSTENLFDYPTQDDKQSAIGQKPYDVVNSNDDDDDE